MAQGGGRGHLYSSLKWFYACVKIFKCLRTSTMTSSIYSVGFCSVALSSQVAGNISKCIMLTYIHVE